MPDILERMSKDLGVAEEWLEFALADAQTSYKKIRITKPSGGTRTVLHPAIETKMIQAWLSLRVFSYLSVSSIATAFEKGTSIVKNASAHQASQYSVRVDLSDFFPSIRAQDLFGTMRASTDALPGWALDADLAMVILKACFDAKQRLPIGYPTSPKIANVVMREFDIRLLLAVQNSPERFGSAVLTRYADDFVFSTDRKGSCAEFLKEFRTQLASMTSPRLQLNEKKTKMMSRRSGSTLVTGLRVKPNGQVGLHAEHRDHIRMLLRLYSKGILRREDIPRLRGHLAFLEHADPALFTRLSFRFFEDIARLRTDTETLPVAQPAPPLILPLAA